jgi:hypothetical protein
MAGQASGVEGYVVVLESVRVVQKGMPRAGMTRGRESQEDADA